MIPHKKLLIKYLFFDILAAISVWIAFLVFRKYINEISIPHFFIVSLPNRYYLSSLIFFPFFCVFIHYLTGFYLNLIYKTKIHLFFTTFVASLIIAIFVFAFLKLGDVSVSFYYFYISLTVLFLQQFVITYFFRRLIYNHVQHNLKTKKWSLNTIIIGDGKNAEKIAAEIEQATYHHSLIGCVSVMRKNKQKELVNLGSFYDIEEIIDKHQVKQVIVALDDDVEENMLFKIIHELYQYDLEISFIPRLYEILTGSARIGKLGTTPLVSITQINMPDWQISVKRFIDFTVALIGLILMLPLFLFIALRIKSNSKGPVFFLQERVGRYGKTFNIVKFRTMYENSEGTKPQLSSAFDDRITSYGRFLRKYRIDELPQFWNILKGDMSFVGPRPERQYYIDKIIKEAPYYCLLYKIRPGLTSWGPIKVGYTDTLEKMIDRLNYDIIYIENMSLFNDLKIFLLTFEILFKGKGM